MKILFLSQRVPYPPNRGDKISTWRLIDRMRRTHDVTCVAFAHDAADHDAAAKLNGMGIRTLAFPHHEKKQRLLATPLLLTSKPLTLGVYGSRALQDTVDELVKDVDVAYAFSSSMGAFLLPHSLPWVMHFAELDSDKWRQYAEKSKFPMSAVYKREWRTLLAFERRVAKAAITNVFCTPLEEQIFREQIPAAPSAVMRNGVDLEFYRPEPDAAEAGHLVFVGVMDYYPNVEGCVHFVHEVLPLIRAEFPDARFTIIGSRPTPEVERLGQVPGVTVTGFVDDTRDHLRKGAISVAPLRIARGIQNKVLEAMAMGLPVVGTTSATQGVGGRPGEDYLLADGTQAEAEGVLRLLRDPAAARALGLRGRAFVEENYDWEACLAPLDAILENCLSTSR